MSHRPRAGGRSRNLAGGSAGGDSVVIAGVGFADATSASFGTRPAPAAPQGACPERLTRIPPSLLVLGLLRVRTIATGAAERINKNGPRTGRPLVRGSASRHRQEGS